MSSIRVVRQFRVVLAASALAVAAGGVAAGADAPIVMKFSHVVTPDAPKGRGAEKFKELAAKYTGGRVAVEIYLTDDLAEKENVEALAAIAKSGKTTVYELTADERRQWVDALRPVHAEMASRVGKDLVRQLYEATGSEAGK